jgi:hypothetical protein
MLSSSHPLGENLLNSAAALSAETPTAWDDYLQQMVAPCSSLSQVKHVCNAWCEIIYRMQQSAAHSSTEWFSWYMQKCTWGVGMLIQFASQHPVLFTTAFLTTSAIFYNYVGIVTNFIANVGAARHQSDISLDLIANSMEKIDKNMAIRIQQLLKDSPEIAEKVKHNAEVLNKVAEDLFKLRQVSDAQLPLLRHSAEYALNSALVLKPLAENAFSAEQVTALHQLTRPEIMSALAALARQTLNCTEFKQY